MVLPMRLGLLLLLLGLGVRMMMMLMLPMVPVSWKGGYHAGLLYALFYGIGHGARHHSVVSLSGVSEISVYSENR